MKIDPRHLQALLAIAEQGSFGRAAQVLNISQPALSEAISILEQRMGAAVLVRSAKGTSLNELGEILYRHAQNMQSALRAVQDETEAHKAGMSGTLRIGGTPVALLELGAPALARVAREVPIRVDVMEGADDELQALLQQGDIDVFFGTVGVDTDLGGLVEERLSQVSFEVYVRSGHDLARRSALTIGDLSSWDGQWALPAAGSVFRRQIESMFIAAGNPFPRHCISCRTAAFQKELALQMDCATILPPSSVALEVGSGALQRLAIDTAALSRSIGLRYQKNRLLSPLGQRVLQAAREVAAEK